MYYLAARSNALVREIAFPELPPVLLPCFTGHVEAMGLLPVLCIDFYQNIGEHDIEQSPRIRINPTWALLQAPALSSLPVILDLSAGGFAWTYTVR